jgi:hypothetical protein
VTQHVSRGDGLGAVFRAALTSFDRATVSDTAQETVRLGGRRLTLFSAGHAANSAIPDAISHLERDSDPDGAVTLHVWDSASTGAPAPPLPPTGIYRSDRDGIELAVGEHPPQLDGIRHDGTAVSWCADELERPAFHQMRPFHRLLDEIAVPPASVIHAAAVGDEHGVALLVGPSGSGKSTTSLLCHAAGMPVLADDRAILIPGSNGDPPTVESIYRSVKLRRDSVTRLSAAKAAQEIGDDEHFVLLPERSMTRRGPLTAIVVVGPGRRGSGPRLVAIAPPDRRGILMPTAVPTIARRPRALRTWMRARSEIEGPIPAFHLELDWDHERVPALVDAARLGRPTECSA